ncbi:MAG TPA: universal stress protein [Candidatus Dormibacteraeota bacterium]
MASQFVKRIVVGVDGSAHSAAALDWAIGLAKLAGAEVIAVHGLYIPVYAATGYAPVLQFDPEWRKQMRQAFEEWCEPLTSSEVPYRTIFREGRPASVLMDAADSLQADLVVVGRRGRGSLVELMLGSVSHELSHHCKQPVVVISHPAQLAAVEAPADEVAALR